MEEKEPQEKPHEWSPKSSKPTGENPSQPMKSMKKMGETLVQ